MRSNHVLVCAGGLVLVIIGSSCDAGFVPYYSLASWKSATGTWTTLDFVFPEVTLLDDQYASQGVLFPEFDVAGPSLSSPSGDGWVLASGGSTSIAQFLSPQHAFGLLLAGSVNLKVYAGDQLLLSTIAVSTFTGFTSTVAFDRVEMWNPGGILVDNLYFSAIPAPATVSVFVAIACGRGRRRRARSAAARSQDSGLRSQGESTRSAEPRCLPTDS